MKIRESGIYFRQVDIREEKYILKHKEGVFTKRMHEEQSTWEKLKYFATYGYQLKEKYTCTIYFQFLHIQDQLRVRYNTLYLDAVSAAKELKDDWLLGKWAELKFIVHNMNPVVLCLDEEDVTLEFSTDGRTLTTFGKIDVFDKRKFIFLDWSSL
jgi:hypothetical protein